MTIEDIVKNGKVNLNDLKKLSDEEQYKVFIYLAINDGRVVE